MIPPIRNKADQCIIMTPSHMVRAGVLKKAESCEEWLTDWCCDFFMGFSSQRGDKLRY